jgi:hypothetical protein
MTPKEMFGFLAQARSWTRLVTSAHMLSARKASLVQRSILNLREISELSFARGSSKCRRGGIGARRLTALIKITNAVR